MASGVPGSWVEAEHMSLSLADPAACSCQRPPAKCLALLKSLPGWIGPSFSLVAEVGVGAGPTVSGTPPWHQRNWICCEM